MKIDRILMGQWVVEALKKLGGTKHFIEIAKQVYLDHEAQIVAAGDYLYKWQYEMRWAGDLLVKRGLMVKSAMGKRGVWALTSKGFAA